MATFSAIYGYPYNDLVICKDSPDYLRHLDDLWSPAFSNLESLCTFRNSLIDISSKTSTRIRDCLSISKSVKKIFYIVFKFVHFKGLTLNLEVPQLAL